MAEDQKQQANQSQAKPPKGNNNMMLIVGIIVVVLLALGGAYFMMNSRTTAPTTDTVQPTQDVMEEDEMMEDDETLESTSEGDAMMEDDETGDAMMEGEAREIMVEGDEYSFSPSSITLEEGETVRVTFENVGSLPHDFVIDELGIQTQTIPAGDTDTVEFTADQSGTFVFYCSVGNHRSLGMEGDLEIQ